jgi:hypothetical protein
VKQGRRTPFGPAPLVAAALVLLVLLDGASVSAQTAAGAELVILLQPAAASAGVRRSVARIRDELSADRFDVMVADWSGAGEPGAVLANAAGRAEGGTVLVLFGDPETGPVELCVVRRAARRTAIRRTAVAADDPEAMPELLAKRALELLRATALELSLSLDGEPASRAAKAPEARAESELRAGAAPPVPAPDAAIVAVDMGVGMWSSVDGPPPAVAPVGRIGLRLSDWAWARLSVAGWGSRPRVESPYGSATLSQTMALFEFAAVLRRGRRVCPTASLGAGVINVAIVGTGAAPYEGREPQRWSAAFDGGAGLAFAVSAHAALVTELHALLAAPHPVVRFVDTRAAIVAYPSVIVTLALRVTP